MLKALVELSRGNAGLVRKMVAEVPEGRMCHQPVNLPNHPAWQVGHLTSVRVAVSRGLGKPIDIDEAWLKRFARGSVPVADAAAYPGKEELMATFVRAQEHLEGVLAGLDEAVLDGPNPVERLRERLPTVRHFVTFVLMVHDGIHVGQLADWRRTEGLPGVM